MMDAELLKLLCCPETYQELRLADSSLLEQVNKNIAAGAFAKLAFGIA
jgi:uncharacterized protein YbaR (Trm112 family)